MEDEHTKNLSEDIMVYQYILDKPVKLCQSE